MPLLSPTTTTTSLTATAQPTHVPPRVLLHAQNASTHGLYGYVTRLDPDGTTRAVRSAQGVSLVGGEWYGYDYEAPFGAAVTYSLTVSDDPDAPVFDLAGNRLIAATDAPPVVASASGVTLAPSRPWLIHPLTPALATSSVTIHSVEAVSRPARSGVFDVINRPRPIVTSQSRRGPSSTLRVLTKTTADQAMLGALLDDGTPLLFREGLGYGIASKWLSVGDVTEGRAFAQVLPDALRVWEMPYVEVDPPVGDVTLQGSYATADAAFADYAAMTAAEATYADLFLANS